MSTESIKVTVDANSGNIVRYYCDHATQNNPNLNQIHMPFAYEMKYDCSNTSLQSISDGIEVMEETMLFKLKGEYLPDVSRCSAPQTLWFSSIDARPPDVYVPARPCTHFNVSGDIDTCCVSVQGNMTFTEISTVGDKMDQLLTASSNAVAASNGSAGYQVIYLGADLQVVTTTSKDNIGASTHNDNTPDAPPSSPDESESFTVMGTFVLLFLVLCIIGVLGFLLYARRRSKLESEFGLAVSKSEDSHKLKDADELALEQAEQDFEQNWFEPRRLPTLEAEPQQPQQAQQQLQMETNVHVLNDDEDDIYIRSIASQPFGGVDANSAVRASSQNSRPKSDFRWDWDDDVQEEEKHQHQQNATLLSYAASGQRRQLQLESSTPSAAQPPEQTYKYSIGGIAINTVPAFPGEVSASELSDADSWAQTEGTVGSLDSAA